MRKTAIFICTAVSFFMFTGFVFAQSYTPLAQLPGTFDTATGKTEMGAYLSGMLKLLIALGAVVAVLMAVAGGTQ
ncbi:MAG: hypothetical protein HZB12_00340, partial [Candidatus Yonathbacteria bacterium]|nr:hypothetical protein [Candidatus Yonathbacteria bacterium]